jgi:hypothetical protein
MQLFTVRNAGRSGAGVGIGPGAAIRLPQTNPVVAG